MPWPFHPALRNSPKPWPGRHPPASRRPAREPSPGSGCPPPVSGSTVRPPARGRGSERADRDAETYPIYGRCPWWDVPESPDNAELRFVERLRARDERAFNELVQAYEGRVFRLVFRMVGRRSEAEDMAQEVFVQVFKAIGQFRGESKLSTWIYRIATNLCKNRVKYLTRRHEGSQTELEPMAERAPLEDAKGVTFGDVARPDQLVEGFQLESIVHRCIAELEPDFREALILRDVEDLSYEEIAEITGLPDGTVKSRIHRARAMLKSAVESAMGERIG
ncbi:MAG: sigma-70 family RNA polymerase sigma factor [Polyangiaceae bacterium]|nr:sigma-70 family RNA polymerase sigma factor [Polyangiaceae bacterium]